jgi:hypothetical protein
LIANANSNQCQVATCDALKGVVLNAKVCPPAAPCTKSYCDTARGCVSDAIVCPTTTDSSTYICNVATNQCELHAPNCDDGNACTVDSFIAGQGCQHTALCVAPDSCTVTSCSNGQCANTAINCDDGNVCTIDSCNLETGACQHDLITCPCGSDNIGTCDPVQGICQIRKSCVTCSDCDDNDPATTDLCTPIGCTNTPIVSTDSSSY